MSNEEIRKHTTGIYMLVNNLIKTDYLLWIHKAIEEIS